MKSSNVIAEAYQVGQRDLATFLNINRSLLAMSATMQRNLPPQAGQILVDMATALELNTPLEDLPTTQAYAEHANQEQLSALQHRPAHLTLKLHEAEQQLATMQSSYAHNLRKVHAIERLLNGSGEQELAEWQHSWLNIQHRKAKEALAKQNPHQQDMLALKIKLIRTELKEVKALLAKHGG